MLLCPLAFASCQTDPTEQITVFKFLDRDTVTKTSEDFWVDRHLVQVSPELFELMKRPSLFSVGSPQPPLVFNTQDDDPLTLSEYEIAKEGGIAVLTSVQNGVYAEIWLDEPVIYGRFTLEDRTYVFDSTNVPDEFNLSSYEGNFPETEDDWTTPPLLEVPDGVKPLRECDSNPYNLPIGKPRAIINVGVVYSASAQARMPSIELAIRSSVRRMQAAMATPNYYLRFNISNLSLTSFSETTSTATDLNNLRNSSAIAQLRDRTKSDVIAFVGNYSGTCGRGYLNENVHPGHASYAFSVTSYQCLTNETLAHEVGHNFGLRHDYATDSRGGLNHGYISHRAKKRSIMAYNNPCAAKGYYCSRISRFSSPKYPITKSENFGDTRSNNLEVICLAAQTIASFR